VFIITVAFAPSAATPEGLVGSKMLIEIIL
jgi:hypothetical protein